jgi:glycosyltransferase involved in cell wall biosynthesis
VNQDVSEPASARVGLVTGCLPLGGSTTFLCNLAGELVRRNIAAEVLSFEKENFMAADFARLNIPVFPTDQHHAIYEDRAHLILERLKQFKATAVLATLASTSFEILRYVPPGVFRVGVFQSDDPLVYENLGPYAPHMDMLAVVSQTMKRKAGALPHFAQVPVACLPYGVPIPEDDAIAARDFNRPLQILYLGRLAREQKRVHLFPAIRDQLISSGIPFHWTIAGDGPDRNFLQSALQCSLPNQTVSFSGQVAYGGVPQLLAAHDIFLLASDYEGLPLSILEAMGSGLVPVVSDLPSGIGEVVDETTGKRVAPDNIAGYAQAIVGLHEHRDELRRLSQNARAKVQHRFSVGAMTDRWLDVLPRRTQADIHWPAQWAIKPVLGGENALRYWPPVRAFRRLFIRFFR